MSLLALVPSALLLLSQSPSSPVSYSLSLSTSPSSPSSSSSFSRVHPHPHRPKAMSFESLEGNRRRGRKKQTTKAVFSCRYCGKGFPRNEHMLRHERKHTGEKPFACLFDGCNKTFSRYDNMMPHFRHHFGYSRNQEAAERAEREIPLLRENTVDELKRMSREKNPAPGGASPVAVVTSPARKAQNHRAPPSPAASSCSAQSDTSSLNHGESEMDFSDEEEDEEEISAGDTEEIEEEAIVTTSADLGSKMQFLAVAAALGAAPSPAITSEAPQSSGSAQQLLLGGNQQLSSSSSSLSTPSTSSSPVPLLLPFSSPMAGSMTTTAAISYQARPSSLLLGPHQPAFVPNVQQFDRELLSKFKGPL